MKKTFYILTLLAICLITASCGKSVSEKPTQDEYVVDIFNCFRQENIDSQHDEITFSNQDTCIILKRDESGEYHCQNLEGKIIMYYPDDYNIVFMLCDTLASTGELYVYIDSTRYLLSPQQPYAIYPLNEFLTKYIYLNLFPGDTLFDNDQTVSVQEESLYEIVEVRNEYLMVREAFYDETSSPRIISQPSKPTYLYHWRNGYTLNTTRFVIDE